jgi:hypothetical protein
MLEPNLITVQQYAIKHKMSTFAVLKLVNAKKLQTIKKKVDNHDQEYIVDDSLLNNQVRIQEAVTTNVSKQEGGIDYEVEFHKLSAKYIELQEKYTKLIEAK